MRSRTTPLGFHKLVTSAARAAEIMLGPVGYVANRTGTREEDCSLDPNAAQGQIRVIGVAMSNANADTGILGAAGYSKSAEACKLSGRVDEKDHSLQGIAAGRSLSPEEEGS